MGMGGGCLPSVPSTEGTGAPAAPSWRWDQLCSLWSLWLGRMGMGMGLSSAAQGLQVTPPDAAISHPPAPPS